MEPDWEREAPDPRQRRTDLLVGAGLAAATVVSMELSRSIGTPFDDAPGPLERTAWALAVALPLCLRRRFPVAVMLVVAAAYVGHQARFVLDPIMTSVCLYLALYTAGAWGQDRRTTTAARLVVVVAMFAWLAISLTTTRWQPDAADGDGLVPAQAAAVLFAAATNVAYFGAGWVFGDRAWLQARTLAELRLRNEQLREERAENARRAVMEERVRIARELHDVVAHHVSVMGVQAGAARRVMSSRPDDAREAIGRVEQSARDATEEMRRLLGVLRDDAPAQPTGQPAGRPAHEGEAAGRAPAPGPDRLPVLVERTASTGLQAELVQVGTPRPLPPGLGVTVYRVVQEALTNTVRHSGARRVDVRLRWLDAAVEVEVVDDGTGTPGVRTEPGAGLGLVGMRERVAVHDGELEVGPRLDGGFRVRARFPLAAPSAGPVGPLGPVGAEAVATEAVRP